MAKKMYGLWLHEKKIWAREQDGTLLRSANQGVIAMHMVNDWPKEMGDLETASVEEIRDDGLPDVSSVEEKAFKAFFGKPVITFGRADQVGIPDVINKAVSEVDGKIKPDIRLAYDILCALERETDCCTIDFPLWAENWSDDLDEQMTKALLDWLQRWLDGPQNDSSKSFWNRSIWMAVLTLIGTFKIALGVKEED
jgi:hypothetical protein